MNRLLLAGLLAVIFGLSVSIQAQDDYNKNEYYGGYSNQQVNEGQRATFHGVEAAYVRNIHRYFGVKGDFSGAFFEKKTPIGNVTIEDKRRVYNFLGGVQIKDNATEKRLQPFGHVLAGVGHVRTRFICPVCLPITNNFNATGFAAALGGGLDIRLNSKVTFRAIQADYNPIFVRNSVNNNARFGIGFVFK